MISQTVKQRLKIINHYISKMPSLSTTAMKVMEICNKPSTSPNDLNHVISLDPVLAGQVLKLVNSAYYSLVNRVTSLTRAIIILGINTIKNMALSLSIMASIKGPKSFRAITIDEFWTHSISVGVIAKKLAVSKNISLSHREDFFVAGLLHDLGKIPMDGSFPEDYAQVKEMVDNEQIPLLEAERTVFGFDHGSIGRVIAAKWRLDEKLLNVFKYHHNPEVFEGGDRAFVETIALANALTNIMKIDIWDNDLIYGTNIPELLERLNIDPEGLLNLRQTVIEELEKAKVFLQITKEY